MHSWNGAGYRARTTQLIPHASGTNFPQSSQRGRCRFPNRSVNRHVRQSVAGGSVRGPPQTTQRSDSTEQGFTTRTEGAMARPAIPQSPLTTTPDGDRMLNLTASPIWLLTAEGPSDIILHPTVLTAAEHVRDGYVLSGERIRTGTSAMDAATLQPANADQIAALNRFLQMEIERDRAENGGDGLVLVDHEVLHHVDPRLAAHVAEPHPDALLRGTDGPVKVGMLIRPPAAPAPEPDRTDRKPAGYTLYLDRAGVATNNPTTDEIGHAETWEQLQWMARGAEPFERAGRLWALNNQTHTVLFMADIKLDQDPHAIQPEDAR